jgi:hypothetical protein
MSKGTRASERKARSTYHSGDTAISSDVGGDSLEGHDGGGTGLLGDLGLLDVHNVHNDTVCKRWSMGYGSAAVAGRISRITRSPGRPRLYTRGRREEGGGGDTEWKAV